LEAGKPTVEKLENSVSWFIDGNFFPRLHILEGKSSGLFSPLSKH
jgi:hypothetical protein